MRSPLTDPSATVRQALVRSAFALAALLLSALPARAAPDERQLALFAANCVQCHVRPATGAPLAGDATAWQARRAQGEEAMLRNVVEGLRGMPPLGYCSACTEQDLRELTRLLAGSDGGTP